MIYAAKRRVDGAFPRMRLLFQRNRLVGCLDGHCKFPDGAVTGVLGNEPGERRAYGSLLSQPQARQMWELRLQFL